MSDPKVDWEKVFGDIGEDHVQLVGYSGEYSIPVERLYQAFKQRLMQEICIGKKIKKEKHRA
jgi:hypothetical protein